MSVMLRPIRFTFYYVVWFNSVLNFFLLRLRYLSVKTAGVGVIVSGMK